MVAIEKSGQSIPRRLWRRPSPASHRRSTLKPLLVPSPTTIDFRPFPPTAARYPYLNQHTHSRRHNLTTAPAMASLSTHSLRPSNSSQSVRNVSGSQSGRPGAPPLTVENALAQANGNTSVALENVVNERNMLSNQNTQLWRLIEKQRSVGKELERVRAERDRAVAKLESRNVGEGGSTSSLSSSTTTRIRASPSAPSATTMATSADDSDAATTPSKPRTIRHNSSGAFGVKCP